MKSLVPAKQRRRDVRRNGGTASQRPATWRGRVPCNEDTAATAAKEIRGRYNGNDNGCVAVGYSAASRLASLAADWLIRVGSIAGKHGKFACNRRLRHTRYTEHFAKHRFPLTANTGAPSIRFLANFQSTRPSHCLQSLVARFWGKGAVRSEGNGECESEGQSNGVNNNNVNDERGIGYFSERCLGITSKQRIFNRVQMI